MLQRKNDSSSVHPGVYTNVCLTSEAWLCCPIYPDSTRRSYIFLQAKMETFSTTDSLFENVCLHHSHLSQGVSAAEMSLSLRVRLPATFEHTLPSAHLSQPVATSPPPGGLPGSSLSLFMLPVGYSLKYNSDCFPSTLFKPLLVLMSEWIRLVVKARPGFTFCLDHSLALDLVELW